MDDYRRTLDVLGHLRQPEGAASAGPSGTEDPSSPEQGGGAQGRVRIGSSSPPLVFGDESAGPPPTPRSRHERDRALSIMQRPAHRFGGVLGVVLLCLVIAAALIAYAVVRTRHDTTAGLGGGHPAGTAHASSPSTPASTGRKGATAHHRGSGATTPPTRYTPSNATASSATYVPRRSEYTITLGALGAPCWVSVTSASGSTVLEQTFAPGASATVKLSGTSTLDIGAPKAVSLDIGGVPAVIPATAAGPFSVTLSPRPPSG